MNLKTNKVKALKGSFLKTRDITIVINDFKHPIFCFKYLHKDFHFDSCNNDEKISLINKVVKLSTMQWTDIQLSNKHGMGSEKIATRSIKPSLPRIVTDDVKFLLALRFHGKAPFVGMRNKFIFHILYLDLTFSCYNH